MGLSIVQPSWSAFLPGWYLPVFCFVVGAVVGSFANVVIYRVPRAKSIGGRSACPSCGEPIAWYDNIPLLSYLILGGRCRKCRAPISPRYPLVELSVGLLWLLVALRIGWAAELPAFGVLATTLVILSVIDLQYQRLPNRVLYPAASVALILLGVAAAATNRWDHLLNAGIGGFAYGLPMLAVAFAIPAGMGMGDVKLAGYLGLHLGWLGLSHVLLGALLGILLGGALGTALLVTGRKGRKDPIPFGPFMAAGATIAVMAGRPILDFWLG